MWEGLFFLPVEASIRWTTCGGTHNFSRCASGACSFMGAPGVLAWMHVDTFGLVSIVAVSQSVHHVNWDGRGPNLHHEHHVQHARYGRHLCDSLVGRPAVVVQASSFLVFIENGKNYYFRQDQIRNSTDNRCSYCEAVGVAFMHFPSTHVRFNPFAFFLVTAMCLITDLIAYFDFNKTYQM